MFMLWWGCSVDAKMQGIVAVLHVFGAMFTVRVKVYRFVKNGVDLIGQICNILDTV